MRHHPDTLMFWKEKHNVLLDEVQALLKRIEWIYSDECPACGNMKYEGHKRDCELARIINLSNP